MADVYKTLGQVVGTTGWTNLYFIEYPAAVTVGGADVAPRAVFSSTQTLVTSIIVCNTGGSAQTFSISLEGTTDGEDPLTPAAINMLFSGAAVAIGETHVLSLGLTLSAGDYLKVSANAGTAVTFTAMGIEIT